MSMETIFMNTENSKTNELELKSSNKNVSRQNLSIYYAWKNIRKHYKNNKLKIIAPT